MVTRRDQEERAKGHQGRDRGESWRHADQALGTSKAHEVVVAVAVNSAISEGRSGTAGSSLNHHIDADFRRRVSRI